MPLSEEDEDSSHLQHKHLLLVLHRVPQLEQTQQIVFIWRSPDGRWKCYRQGEPYNSQQDGLRVFAQHLNDYDSVEKQLSSDYDQVKRSSVYLRILEDVTTKHHAAHNLSNTLQEAHQAVLEDPRLINK